ncbi:MAG: HD domain-containing phosphohydrolase [Candidatus Bipolaricaulota bacterium]
MEKLDLVALRIISEEGVEYVSQAHGRITGYNLEDCPADTMSMIHPEDRERVAALARQREIGEIGPSDHMQLRMFRKDGSIVHVLLSVVPLEYKGNRAHVSAMVDVTKRMRTYEQLHTTLEGTIQAMARVVETRDPYTAGHQRRAAALAYAIAEKMEVPEETTAGIQMAGFIHDLGKLRVPADILTNPGQLTEHEFAIIKTHPQVAYDILKDIDFPWPVADIVLQHHERSDGSGYPQGLAGSDILVEAQILGVADVVEAMSSHRPYRPALGIETALEEISGGKGTRYAPTPAEACLGLFEDGTFSFEA